MKVYRLPWECDGDDLIVRALRGTDPSLQSSVYVAKDDPYAGVEIDSIEMMDDLIRRLQQAREWLKNQNSETEPST